MRKYTELKDVNGKDIYEGDIVKRYDKPNDSLHGVVRYCDGAYYIESYISSEEYGIENMKFLSDEFMEGGKHGLKEGDVVTPNEMFGKIRDSIEVVGNIYENPELISKTHRYDE